MVEFELYLKTINSFQLTGNFKLCHLVSPVCNVWRPYNTSDVDLEKKGLLDKPSYLEGLPDHHPLKSNENVFPFSSHLASFEVFHLMALVTGIGNVNDFGVQRYRYKNGF